MLLLIILTQISYISYLNIITVPLLPEFVTYDFVEDPFPVKERNNVDITQDPAVLKVENKARSLHPFDPNTLDSAGWLGLGLSIRQVATILNYRNKGGQFYRKEDFGRIYGISLEEYKILEPYIAIENSKYDKQKKTADLKSEFDFQIISINSADTAELLKLPLIGPARARMIVKYRKALGGFVSVNQLLEVYTIDSLVFEKIKNRVKVEGEVIKTININSDSIYHPYLKKQVAEAIINFRRQHGNYSEPNDLKKIKIIDNELYNKVVPYIAFE